MWIGVDDGSYEFYGRHFCFYMTRLVAAMQIKDGSYSTSQIIIDLQTEF